MLDGGLAIDDRGKVVFFKDFDFKDVKRFYMVENHRVGFIRAWHGHKKEAKYVFVPKGTAIVATISMEDEGVQKWVLSGDKPQILCVPPGHYNGFKTLTDNAMVMFFSTATLDESLSDDYREPYDRWDVFGETQR